MEKILTIDGRQVRFKSTGAFLLRYKMQFGRDAIADVYKMYEAVEKNPETGEKEVSLNALDSEVFYNLVWTLAKTADPTIPPPLEWLDTFDTFPLDEILPELMDMVLASLTSTVQDKKK